MKSLKQILIEDVSIRKRSTQAKLTRALLACFYLRISLQTNMFQDLESRNLALLLKLG